MNSLKWRYVAFISSIAITVLASQLIIQFDLNLQNSDARFINIAGRQRMLSQRISKLVLYLHYDIHQSKGSKKNRVDTLRKAVDTWEKAHRYLQNENMTMRKSKAIEAELASTTRNIEVIAGICKELIKNASSVTIDQALDSIAAHDVPYLLSMEKAVSIYQSEAESKLANIKRIEWILAGSIILILCLGFFFLILPAIRSLVALNNGLKKSEELYRLVSENSQDFIALHEPDGTYTFVSPSAKELLGYQPEELIGLSGFSLIHPDDLKLIMTGPREEVLKGSVVLHTRFRLRKKDNSYLWVEVYTKPILDMNGKVIKVQTSARDISARKEIEEKLAESERLYRLISTNAKDLISLYEAVEDPIRIYISPSSKEIMGYDPEEMVGRSPYDFILPEDATEMKKTIHLLTLSGKSATKEYRAIKKDGTIIWLETISNPFFDEHHNMIGFQTSARDITQRKAFEMELIIAKENSEIVSSQLNDLLAEKNDLIGLLSHDMRSPINQVKGLAQVMAMSMNEHATLKDCLSKMDQAVNRQLELFQNVLSMLKADQMSSDSEHFAAVSLLALVNIVRRNLEWDLENKGIRLSLKIPETLEVNVQQNFFIQAIHNLLSNSIKFSPAGKEINVNAESNSDFVTITIQDYGVGFVPEKAELLFERFTKEGRRGTNNEASTGLGLYLVRKILKNHNGIITAHSDGEGKGSSFIIQLAKNN